MAERSKKKKTVRSISGPGFRSARDLSLKEIKKLSVPSFDRVVEHLLPDLGWKGDLYGSVGLILSNDNKSIVNGNFFLSGQLFPGSESKRFQAAKFWSAGTDLDLQLSINNASIFNFSSTLTSDFVDGSDVTHAFFKGNQRLETEEAEAAGIPGFCLRLFVAPSKETFAKLTLVLYPLPLAVLLESQLLAENVRFPGLSVFSGEFPIGPPQTAVPRTPTPYGCPILPVVIPGSPLTDFPNTPSGIEIHRKIAEVLRAAVKPEIKNGPAMLLKRWTEIQNAGPSKLLNKQLDIMWPLPPPAPPRDGSEEEYEDGDDESEHSEGDTVASDLGGQSSSEHSEDDCASSEVEPLEQDSDQSEPEESERHSTTGDDTLSAAGTPMKVLQRRLQKELERAGKAKKGKPMDFGKKRSTDKSTKRKRGEKEKPAKKKKRELPRSSSSDSEDSSENDLEESKDWSPTSNMAKFEELWPVSERPQRFRDPKAFNKLQESSVYNLYNMQQEIQKKKKGNTFESLNKVVRLKTKHFKAGKDDGYYAFLHPARFSMIPFGPPKKWWKLVPTNRDEDGNCIDMPLDSYGCLNLVAPKVLLWMLDRTIPKLLKHFLAENANVAYKPRKKIERMEEGEVTSLMDFWWKECDALLSAQEAIQTYTAILHVVWTCDASGINMNRLLTKYRWISVAGDEAKRVAVVTMFFNSVVDENCKRAINQKPPYTFAEQEVLLKRVLERNGLKTDPPLLGAKADATPAGGLGGSGQSNNWVPKSRSASNFNPVNKKKPERKFAEFDGLRTCYQFNTPRGNECKNRRAGAGCVDPGGVKKYAHVCNKFLADKAAFCLQRHPRRDHR